MHTSLQRQQEIKIDIVNKELSNNAWYDTQGNGHWIWVTKNKGGQKNDAVVFNWIQCLGFQYTVFFFLFCFFFSQLFTRLKRSSSFRGKMIQKWSEGKQKLLRVSRRFELSGVNCILFKVKIICQTPTYSWN